MCELMNPLLKELMTSGETYGNATMVEADKMDDKNRKKKRRREDRLRKSKT